MKNLLLMRHAKSSWDNAHLSDYDRPLNKRGQVNAPRMGQWLAQQELVPDLIISSSAERALATAEAVALACGYEKEIQVFRTLYHGDPEDYLALLAAVPDAVQRVMMVGHNPGIAELVGQLTEAWEQMPTAAVAHVALPIDHWADVNEETIGQLLALWQPRDLPG
ncbi:MAG: histidine phosphatase family protein [Anaerolineales bacterium]|nr:histidine phosphatase family protein [Anaerolineales bacterium]MCB8951738.1 histidine phosphatase family protein [Ardenticatenales bacterium]